MSVTRVGSTLDSRGQDLHRDESAEQGAVMLRRGDGSCTGVKAWTNPFVEVETRTTAAVRAGATLENH